MEDAIVALVPMKHNSERVKNKNHREFNGRPLFHWILATLEKAELVDRIVVNTDSTQIAEGAIDQFNVEIIRRPEHLCGDSISMNRIIQYDIEHTEADLYLQTHCTNPLVKPETVDRAIQTFKTSSFDSLFSVSRIQSRYWTSDAEPINHDRNQLIPTQNLDPTYKENSNIYLFNKKMFEVQQNRIGSEPLLFEMEYAESVDIDYPVDFQIAECLHQREYGVNPSFKDVLGS